MLTSQGCFGRKEFLFKSLCQENTSIQRQRKLKRYAHFWVMMKVINFLSEIELSPAESIEDIGGLHNE